MNYLDEVINQQNSIQFGDSPEDDECKKTEWLPQSSIYLNSVNECLD